MEQKEKRKKSFFPRYTCVKWLYSYIIRPGSIVRKMAFTILFDSSFFSVSRSLLIKIIIIIRSTLDLNFTLWYMGACFVYVFVCRMGLLDIISNYYLFCVNMKYTRSRLQDLFPLGLVEKLSLIQYEWMNGLKVKIVPRGQIRTNDRILIRIRKPNANNVWFNM